jgi:two-component system, sensor histidine kinase and response regulator
MQETHYQERPQLLVVDDEAVNVQLISRIFQRTCEIDSAENGHEALQKLSQNTYDVVLLDIMMPQLSGLDVLRSIRASSDLSELPVVLISAVDEKSEVARGIRLGANDYITKPVDMDIVQARVSTQIKIKQLRDERARMIAQLQAANEMKARMMQVASHDLKTPLNNLQMLTQLMRRQNEENPRLIKLLNMQQDSLDAMLRVVLDFLDSSISSSQIHVNLRPLDCVSIVRQVLNQYSVAAHNKQISLEHDVITGVVIADDNRLLQVLGNLVSNAIKYSPKGGTVQVSTENKARHWRLTVRDSGAGVLEAEQEFLFKPFSKHEISTQPTDGESSTGLGLWIVHEMMRLQAGTVGMYNHPEGGACFWIELPLAQKGVEV